MSGHGNNSNAHVLINTYPEGGRSTVEATHPREGTRIDECFDTAMHMNLGKGANHTKPPTA